MEAGTFSKACGEIGLPLSAVQLASFIEFENRLYTANELMNLTRVPRRECWLRHFMDSLVIHDLIPPGAKVLDIGTGPGFPAWPLACGREDLAVTALDSSGKMLGFLRGSPLPNLVAVQARAEEWARDHAEQFDFVTGRALAPLAVQLELSAAFSKIGGLVAPMRSSGEREQIAKLPSFLGLVLKEVAERRLPGTDVVRLLPVYRKAWRTPKGFPRDWPAIKRGHPTL